MNEELALLLEKIKNAQISNGRLTDISKGSYTLEVKTDDKKNLVIALVGEKKNRIPVTVNGLAALRIAVSKDAVSKIESTEDARDSDEIRPFQAAILAEEVKLTPGLKFEVIHRLRMKDSVNGGWVYRNNCYTKYPEFLAASSKANAMPKVTTDEIAARNLAFNEATVALRASGKKTEVTVDEKHLSLIPVFTVK
jgi:hypothetical protein